MKKLVRILTFAAFFILGTVLFSSTISAYIDPSAMTYIVQIVVGIVIAGGAAFGFYFKKIKRKLKKKDPKEEDYDTPNAVEYEDDGEFDDDNLDDFDDFDEDEDGK